MTAEPSPQRLISPDRAPSLRRVAERLEEHAERSPFPQRARRLAREMRIRATEIEVGAQLDPIEQLRANDAPQDDLAPELFAASQLNPHGGLRL